MLSLTRRIIVFALLATLAAPAQALTCTTPSGAAKARDGVIQMVNAERKRAGLAALAPSSKLTKVAQNLACDNAAAQRFSHFGADGADLSARLKRTGYRFRAATENTGRGQDSPQSAVSWWMNSRGHRANILMGSTREIGVGLAVSSAPDSKPHWVVVMAAKL